MASHAAFRRSVRYPAAMPLVNPLDALVARTRTMPTWARYAVTVAITASVFLLRRMADPIMPEGYPFLLLFLPILLSASLFNHGSGLLATALCAALAAYFYLPPLGSLGVAETRNVVGVGLFVAVGTTMALVVETLHNALSGRQQALAELQRANADLTRSEQARGLLLREFRHRTRNDLHSLVGLLLLRARAAPSDAARDGLREAAEHAMALARVHARLVSNGTGGDDAVVVDTREFVIGLCADIEAALAGEGLRPVALVAEAEAYALDNERAVQLGLVLNETVTNALKYAFPEDRAGAVQVCFVREGGEFVLSVTDDGVGLPEEGDVAAPAAAPLPRGTGLGTRLLSALAAQLRGSFNRRPGQDGIGTIAELRFPIDRPGLLTG